MIRKIQSQRINNRFLTILKFVEVTILLLLSILTIAFYKMYEKTHINIREYEKASLDTKILSYKKFLIEDINSSGIEDSNFTIPIEIKPNSSIVRGDFLQYDKLSSSVERLDIYLILKKHVYLNNNNDLLIEYTNYGGIYNIILIRMNLQKALFIKTYNVFYNSGAMIHAPFGEYCIIKTYSTVNKEIIRKFITINNSKIENVKIKKIVVKYDSYLPCNCQTIYDFLPSDFFENIEIIE
jgi:hypothetical protein